MFASIRILVLQLFLLSITQANSVNFEDERTFLQKQFSCQQEYIYPETEISGSKWHCSGLSHNQNLEIIRRQGSQESIKSINLLFFSNPDSAIPEELISLCNSMAERFAGVSSKEVLDVLLNCKTKRQFLGAFKINVGCLEGPVKTERYFNVTMLPSI